MSTPAAFEITRAGIDAVLSAIVTGFPVQFEGGRAVTPAGAAWGRWSITQGSTEPACVGPGHLRGMGFVTLQIFIKEESGTAAALTAADAVAAALDRRQLSLDSGKTIITFEITGLQDAGRRAGYTQKNVACNFRRDTYY